MTVRRSPPSNDYASRTRSVNHVSRSCDAMASTQENLRSDASTLMTGPQFPQASARQKGHPSLHGKQSREVRENPHKTGCRQTDDLSFRARGDDQRLDESAEV